MAASPGIPAPGTKYGPCEPRSPKCEHVDCKYNREDAAKNCTVCGKPIGYEAPYYNHDGGLGHRVCVEELYE